MSLDNEHDTEIFPRPKTPPVYIDTGEPVECICGDMIVLRYRRRDKTTDYVHTRNGRYFCHTGSLPNPARKEPTMEKRHAFVLSVSSNGCQLCGQEKDGPLHSMPDIQFTPQQLLDTLRVTRVNALEAACRAICPACADTDPEWTMEGKFVSHLQDQPAIYYHSLTRTGYSSNSLCIAYKIKQLILETV